MEYDSIDWPPKRHLYCKCLILKLVQYCMIRQIEYHLFFDMMFLVMCDQLYLSLVPIIFFYPVKLSRILWVYIVSNNVN